MAGRNRVTIQGLDVLRKRLAELAPQLTEAAKKTVRESAEAVRDETKQTVTVDTGNQRDSVAIDYQDDGLRAEVGWSERPDFYAAINEFGSRRRPAKPALGPAAELERTRIEDRLKANVRKALP